jgi:hypothetical protein
MGFVAQAINVHMDPDSESGPAHELTAHPLDAAGGLLSGADYHGD